MEYLVKFEKLKTLVLNSHPTLTMSYLALRFINDLDNTLRLTVKMMCPTTVQQATKKAGLQELVLEAIYRKHRLLPKTYLKSIQQIK